MNHWISCCLCIQTVFNNDEQDFHELVRPRWGKMRETESHTWDHRLAKTAIRLIRLNMHTWIEDCRRIFLPQSVAALWHTGFYWVISYNAWLVFLVYILSPRREDYPEIYENDKQLFTRALERERRTSHSSWPHFFPIWLSSWDNDWSIHSGVVCSSPISRWFFARFPPRMWERTRKKEALI